MKMLPVHYSYGLVLVSILISILAAYAAFALADRMRVATTTLQRRLWLLGGSSAMGMGVWSMHYLGMLAMRMPVQVLYYVPTVVFSLLLAMAASAVTLMVVSMEKLSGPRLLAGGVLMGAGIGGMHYVGMFAMRSTARCHYSFWMVLGSVVVAVCAATVALWVGSAVRNKKTHQSRNRVLGGVAMGLGIAAMHYTAMRAVCFTPDGMICGQQPHTVQVNDLGEMAVAMVAGLILIAALAITAMEKMKELREAHAKLASSQDEMLKVQQQLREANELLSELSVRDGLTGVYNRRHFDMTLSSEWRRALRTNNPIALLMIDIDCFKCLNDT
jgi:NO-binding membrane sensor protein with MHYT domain